MSCTKNLGQIKITKFRVMIFGTCLIISRLAFAGDKITLDRAKEYLTANKKCVFSAVKVYTGKTELEKNVMKMMGKKSGDLEELSRPLRTPAFCIFDGFVGAGINKKSACILSYYIFETDGYNWPMAANGSGTVEIFSEEKCTPKATKTLLLEKEARHLINLSGRLTANDLWMFYSIPDPTELKVEIINDDFKISEDVQKAAASRLAELNKKVKAKK